MAWLATACCSVDGLHSSDLTKWLKLRPDSALADLASRGTIYPNTRDVAPSDSFPGITSLITGDIYHRIHPTACVRGL